MVVFTYADGNDVIDRGIEKILHIIFFVKLSKSCSKIMFDNGCRGIKLNYYHVICFRNEGYSLNTTMDTRKVLYK